MFTQSVQVFLRDNEAINLSLNTIIVVVRVLYIPCAAVLVPSPSETSYWDMSVEGLYGGCRAGLALKRCNQTDVFAIHPVG